MNESNEAISTQRRDLLKGAGLVGAGLLAAATTGSLAASAHEAGTAGMHHGRKNSAMTDAMANVVKAGEDCVVHCIDLIQQGDNSLIDCLRSAQEVVAFSKAHAYMSAADSGFLDAMCELSIKVCGNCQKECEKQKKHPICKACGDACAACVQACKKHLKA